MPFRGFLKARHGGRPAGYLTEMTAAMNVVKTMAISCSRSQRGTSYFVSTCGIRKNHKNKRIAKLEDDFGNVTCKEINMPSISHKLCEILLMIDEHALMRQNNLVLERK